MRDKTLIQYLIKGAKQEGIDEMEYRCVELRESLEIALKDKEYALMERDYYVELESEKFNNIRSEIKSIQEYLKQHEFFESASVLKRINRLYEVCSMEESFEDLL